MPRKPARHYRVVIPSYRRPHTLTEKTLPLLANGGVDLARVTVYIHTHDPHWRDYQTISDQHGVGLVATDTHGITEQRNRIVQDHADGVPIVSLDDDITRIAEVVCDTTGRSLLGGVHDLHGFFTGMFRDTAAQDLHVWGVAPVPNPYFMKPGKQTTGLRFIIGTLYGWYNRPDHPVHHITVPVKEDYELSLRAWWWDGAVLRSDSHTVEADHYKLPGGCQDARDPHTSGEAAQQLLAEWPKLTRPNPKRTSGHTEILLATKPRGTGHSVDTPPPGRAVTPRGC